MVWGSWMRKQLKQRERLVEAEEERWGDFL